MDKRPGHRKRGGKCPATPGEGQEEGGKNAKEHNLKFPEEYKGAPGVPKGVLFQQGK